MKYVLHIVWKDMRALWWELSAAVVVTLGMAVAQFLPRPDWQNLLRTLSPVLAVMAWVLLVIQVMRADSLVGTEHDWRTRPIRRRDLVLAKALFVALFVGAPIVLADVIILAGNGFAPLGYAPGLLCKLIWICVVILLPVAALSAITRSLAQALLASMGTAIVLMMGLGLMYSADTGWGGAEWVRVAWVSMAGAAVAVGVLWLQFGRHRTRAAVALAVGGVAVVLLTTGMLPWRAGFGVQALFATEAVSRIRVVPRLGGPISPSAPAALGFYVEDVPEGYRTAGLRGEVTVETDGQRFVTHSMGHWALRVEAPGHENSPGRIHGKVWLAVLSRQARHEIDANSYEVMLEGFGKCGFVFGELPGRRPWANVYCSTPYRAAAGGSLVVRNRSGEEKGEPFVAPESYSPLPSELTILPLGHGGANVPDLEYGIWRDGGRVRLEKWKPVAYVERAFTADVKRLGDFIGKDVGR